MTGSVGKTTTKEMLVSILKQVGYTVASYKNIDPVYNIPMTILKCRPGTRYLVLELGVEYPGEMEFYCWLVKPNIGIITNIYPTHIQFFGSIKGVANEKENLIRHLPKSGFAILNRDNKYLVNRDGRFRIADPDKKATFFEDKYLSLVCYFVLEGNPMGLADYDEMFRELVPFLTEPLRGKLVDKNQFKGVVDIYLTYHPQSRIKDLIR